MWSIQEQNRHPSQAIPIDLPSTVAAAPTPAPTPTATPNPNIEASKIPNWAKSRVILKVPVRPGDKPFALTFDDGPWPEHTQDVLDILARYNVKATFFVVGQEVKRRPQLLKKIRDAGHSIGNHSWDHPSRPRDPVGQVQRTDAVIKATVGFTPTIFRPPYGILKNGMARQAMKGHKPVLIWSADCADWKRPGASHIAMMIENQASPGGIALMHDGGGNRSQTVAALPGIIENLQSRGFELVTIPELLRRRYIAPPKPKKTPRPAKTKKAHAT